MKKLLRVLARIAEISGLVSFALVGLAITAVVLAALMRAWDPNPLAH